VVESAVQRCVHQMNAALTNLGIDIRVGTVPEPMRSSAAAGLWVLSASQ